MNFTSKIYFDLISVADIKARLLQGAKGTEKIDLDLNMSQTRVNEPHTFPRDGICQFVHHVSVLIRSKDPAGFEHDRDYVKVRPEARAEIWCSSFQAISDTRPE